MALRISIDTGGTFTDVVVVDEQGAFHVGKALTTPQRIFQGMHGALGVVAEQLGVPVRDLLARSDMLIYGTTRATNAVVTKRTAKTAFLTTRGFKDTLTLKEGGKHGPHDYSYDYPDPYIPRRYSFEIDERISAEGEICRAARPRAGGGGDRIAARAQASRPSRSVCCGRSPIPSTSSALGGDAGRGAAGRAVHAVAPACADPARVSPRLRHRHRRLAQAADAAPSAQMEAICGTRVLPASS